MTTERQRTGSRLAGPINRPDVRKCPRGSFRSNAKSKNWKRNWTPSTNVSQIWKANGIAVCDGSVERKCDGFCRRIDELRSLLIECS